MLIRALSKRDELDAFVAKCERERDAAKRIPKEDQLHERSLADSRGDSLNLEAILHVDDATSIKG